MRDNYRLTDDYFTSLRLKQFDPPDRFTWLTACVWWILLTLTGLFWWWVAGVLGIL